MPPLEVAVEPQQQLALMELGRPLPSAALTANTLWLQSSSVRPPELFDVAATSGPLQPLHRQFQLHDLDALADTTRGSCAGEEARPFSVAKFEAVLRGSGSALRTAPRAVATRPMAATPMPPATFSQLVDLHSKADSHPASDRGGGLSGSIRLVCW